MDATPHATDQKDETHRGPTEPSAQSKFPAVTWMHSNNDTASSPNPPQLKAMAGGFDQHRKEGAMNGGQGRNRTTDTRIFSPLLYRLSYLASNDICQYARGRFPKREGGIKAARQAFVKHHTIQGVPKHHTPRTAVCPTAAMPKPFPVARIRWVGHPLRRKRSASFPPRETSVLWDQWGSNDTR